MVGTDQSHKCHSGRSTQSQTRSIPCGSHSHFFFLKNYSTLFFFFNFLGLHLWHMEIPRLGVKSDLLLPGHSHSHSKGSDPSCSCSCNLQCSCSSTRSLSHCARPGMEPVSQHSRDGTDPVVPQWELHVIYF